MINWALVYVVLFLFLKKKKKTPRARKTLGVQTKCQSHIFFIFFNFINAS